MALYTGETKVNKPYDPYGELTNDPFETTARLQSRYHEAGQTPPQASRKSIGNLLMGALSFIDTPGNLIRGALQGGYEGAQYGGGLGEILGGAVRGAGSGALHGLSMGNKGEFYTASDWLDRANVNNKYAKGIGGFVGDVALDPLTYLSFGATGVAKGLGTGLVKGAVKKTVAGTTGKIGARMTKALADNPVTERLGRFMDTDAMRKSSGLEGAEDVLTEGERFLGTKGIKGMDIEDRLQAGTGKTDKLIEGFDKTVQDAPQKAKTFYRNILDSKEALEMTGKGIKTSAEDALKLANGDEILRTVPNISSPEMQSLRRNLNQLMPSADIDAMPSEVYNALHHMGEVLSINKLDVANLDGYSKRFLGNTLRMSAMKLKDQLGMSLKDTLKHGNKMATKHLRKVRNSGERLMQSAEQASRNIIEVEYTNALKAVVAETGQRRFVSFMGKPLADITPYTTELTAKVGRGIMASAQGGNRLAQTGVAFADAMSRTFTNTVPLGLKGTPFEPMYHAVADRVSKHKIASGLVPRNSLNGVLNALGQRAVTFGEVPIRFRGQMVKPNDLYVYWKEGIEHTNLHERMLREGVPEDEIAETVSFNAINKYANDILPYIDETSDVYDYFTDLSIRTDMMNSVYKSMDLALGKTYTGTNGYIHHAYYDEMMTDLDELIKSGKSTLSSAGSKAHTPAQARKFKTLADAEVDGGLRAFSNVIDLMSLRQSYTGRLGHRVQLLEGTTKLMDKILDKDDYSKALGYKDDLARKLMAEPEPGMTRVPLDEAMAKAEADRVLDATTESLMRGLGREGLTELKDVIRTKKPVKDASRFVEKSFGRGKESKVYYIDKNIAYQFERLDSLFFNDQNFNRIKNIFDEATRFIKTSQTVVNPAFHLRNNVGEFVMSALDMNPNLLKSSYSKAIQVMKSGGEKVNISGTEYTVDNAIELLSNITNKSTVVTHNGTRTTVKALNDDLVRQTSIQLGDKTYTKKQLLEEFEANGLKDTGVAGETFKESITQMKQSTLGQNLIGAVAKQEALKGKTSLTRGARYAKATYMGLARKASEGTDNYHRLAHYMGAIERGESFQQAAQTVKKFHVDYQDLTRFEKNVMRRLVPYYTFSRKNLPMQLRAMFEKPAYPAVIGHAVDNASSAMGDPTRPQYMDESLAIPFFETEDGNVMSLNLSLPLADLSKFKIGKDMLSEGFREAFGQVNPLVKMLPELGAGQNIGLNIPIQDQLDYIAGNFGATRDIYTGAKKFIEQGENPESAFGRPSVAGINRLLPLTMNNPQQTELSEAYRYRDELLEDMQKKKRKGEPIPQSMSPAEEFAQARGIPLREVPKYISREKYKGKKSYQKYKK